MFTPRTPEKKRVPIVVTLRAEFFSALKLLLLLSALFLAFKSNAQCSQCVQDSAPGPGILHPGTRHVTPYVYVREADVMWSKRIWRTLDLREKMNHPYYYPEQKHDGLQSLFDLIKCGVANGCLTAFDNPAFDDEFKVPMRIEQAMGVMTDTVIQDMEDPNNPGTFYRDTTINVLESTDVMAYWLKEDWFFDKQRSVMDVRILGICPLTVKRDPSTGEVAGYMPLFWIYFPQLRPLLVKQGVFLGQNRAMMLTYDDMFQKRMFASYTHKESNVYDRPINSYATGLDALLESERIKENVMDMEHDLWHY